MVNSKQKGFSLVELMIGLVLGLIAALVITNVFLKYEQQKRTTTGNSDAQTNGAIALYMVQRDLESAGYGLPTYGEEISPFGCKLSDVAANNTEIDHDNVAATPNIGLSPVLISDGTGVNGSDVVSIRYGSTMKSGAAVDVIGPGANVVTVDNNLGCAKGDTALVIRPGVTSASPICALTKVTDLTAAGTTPITITLNAATAPAASASGDSLACLGVWDEYQYQVLKDSASLNSYHLTRTGAISAAGVPNAAAVPVVPDIVSIQAQYGVANNPGDNKITAWVDATGNVWGPTITKDNRNRIKAIRVALVARNGLRETKKLSQACTGGATDLAKICIWNDKAAPSDVDLTALTGWENYRYRVYETIIPLRNIAWSRKVINGGT